MGLATQIQKFIEHPFPLWETALIHQLIQHQWRELESKGLKVPSIIVQHVFGLKTLP